MVPFHDHVLRGASGGTIAAPSMRAISAPEYVGEDRRHAPTPAGWAHYGLAAALLVASWALAAALTARTSTLATRIDTEELTLLFHGAAAVLSTVVALMALVRWRLSGQTTSLVIAAGFLLVGPFAIGVGDLVPLVHPGAPGPGVTGTLRLAGLLGGMAVLAAAALGPAIDTRLRPVRVLTGAAVALSAVVVVMWTVLPAGEASSTPAFRMTLATLWVGVAAAHAAAGFRRGLPVHVWLAAAAVGLGLAEAVAAQALAAGASVGAGTALLRAVAQGLALLGTTGDLEQIVQRHRARLLEAEVGMEALRARRRAEQAAQEERAHDARNALLAIDGAAQTLERHRDRLDPADRQALAEAVTGEIERLHRLIEVHQEEATAPFSLAELLTPIVTTERARGADLVVEVAGDLVALGHAADTAEVVRNLLDNARRYAPGSRVVVRGDSDGAWAMLCVEDRGPGVSREERERIFERGHRGTAAAGTEGSGLGLFVARRLMEEQGGDLWVENRQWGGASLRLCLPLEQAPLDLVLDEQQDGPPVASPNGNGHRRVEGPNGQARRTSWEATR